MAAAALEQSVLESKDKDTLLEILQSEIIPSLVASKGKESCFSAGDEMSEYAPSAEQVYDFSMLCLNPDLSKAEAFVQDLLNNGKSTESVYLNLFAPAARHLGSLWEEDVCNFIQVTIGLVQGERPGTLQVTGIVIALIGVILASGPELN